MRILKRLPMIVAISFLALVQTVALAKSATSECIETCPDDDQDGKCPPACTCACHAPRRPAPAGAVAVVAPAPESAKRSAFDEELPASPEPSEIWHVPKSV